MRNDTLIDFLVVNEREQEDLRTIISSKTKKERKKERNRKAYLDRMAEEGRY